MNYISVDRWFRKRPYILTYENFLNTILQYPIYSEIYVSYPEYNSNKEVYNKAVIEGFIQRILPDECDPYTFLIIKKPTKSFDEETINSYFL